MSSISSDFWDKKKEEEFSTDKIYADTLITQLNPKVRVEDSEYDMKEFQELCDNLIGKPKLNESQSHVFDYMIDIAEIEKERGNTISFLSQMGIHVDFSVEEECQVIKAFMEWYINFLNKDVSK